MIEYNTQRTRLILPEYGRNIQQMVDHCVTIEDRDDRNRCAQTIIDTMANLFPENRQNPDYERKLWDHLAIMSDYTLDIDYPVEITPRDQFATRPEPVAYPMMFDRYRHYGLTIQRSVDKAMEMEPGEERDELIRLLANQMKKLMLAANSDGVDDERIFRDLYDMSRGAIHILPVDLQLNDYKLAPTPGKKKKKKQ